jgi:C_GCAxxG_C_C family probable redox protein
MIGPLAASEMTLDELANWAGDRANQFRLEGYRCSEAVLRAAALAIGVELSDEMLRVSTGFRGGGGGYGDRCGALNSGAMLISLLYGRTKATEDLTCASELTSLLHKRFDDELGATRCSLLLKVYSKQVPDGSCSIVYAAGTRMVVQLLGKPPKLSVDCRPALFVARLKQSG